MISINSILYEIKSLISDEDINAFRDFEDFVKTTAETYLATRLKNKRYMEFIIKAIPVSDYKGVLPKYQEIVMMVGSDNAEEYRKAGVHNFLETEVAAWLKKDNSGNVYTVYKKKADCGSDCEDELILNAELFADELARGTQYSMIKKVYRDYSIDETGCWKAPYNRNYFVMRPTESNLFGLKEKFFKDCINFSAPPTTGTRYDFHITYSPADKANIVKTNFKEGIIILSYHGRVYDEDGFLMVPDNLVNLWEAMKWFVEHAVFHKLANEFKTNDYFNREQNAFQKFLIFNNEVVKEMNHYSYNEIAPIIARAKWHYNTEKTYDALINRDHPDTFRQSLEELYKY